MFFLKKIIAVFLSMFLLIGVSTTSETHGVKDANNVKANFTVLSDVHMEGNNKSSRDVFITLLSDVKNNTSNNDALIFLGDNTMAGQDIENMFFYGILDLMKPADIVFTAMGNHDTGNGVDEYDKLSSRFWNYYNTFYNDSIGEKPYYYKLLNGYYMVFMGSESDAVNSPDISVEQIQWLDSVLLKATETGKPVFVFNHHPYYYCQENNQLLLDTLCKYSNVFYISGHTHTGRTNFTSLDEDTYAFNIPRCAELGAEIAGTGLQIEVYESEVSVRVRNYYSSTWGTEYNFDIK